jgi:hypothetical protein
MADDNFRIIFWNCGGFLNDRTHPKNYLIRNTLINVKADVAALAEINTCWKALQPFDRLYERTRGWFLALHISHAYASEFPSVSANQAGGTLIFTLEDSVHNVVEKTADRWGRWCSTKFRGIQGASFRIISAYRCVQNIHGPLSVWNQLRYLMDLQQCADDPIDRFDKDLLEFIRQCQDAGEQIIIGIDANEDVRTGSFSQKMKEVGLVDVCANRNGSNAPPTYARGTLPIDAIYVSVNLTNSRAGYLPVVSDHRVLWVDVPQRSLFGSRLALIPTRIPQRFTLHDPRVVSRYINSVSSQFQEARLLPRLLELQSQMAEQCTDQLIKTYNELDAIRLQGILRANKSC